MKKLIRNSSLLIIVCLVSCSDYLSVTPQGKVIPETDEEVASLIHRHINNIEGGDDMFVIGNFESIIQYESFADNFDANIKVGSIPAYAGDKINSRQYNFFLLKWSTQNAFCSWVSSLLKLKGSNHKFYDHLLHLDYTCC